MTLYLIILFDLFPGADVSSLFDILEGLYGQHGIRDKPPSTAPASEVETADEATLSEIDTAVPVSTEAVASTSQADPSAPPVKRAKTGSDPLGAGLPKVVPASLGLPSKTEPLPESLYYPTRNDILVEAGVPGDCLPLTHKEKGENPLFICVLCSEKRIYNRPSVITHVRRDHLKIALGCRLCDHYVYSSASWQSHNKKSHSTGDWYQDPPATAKVPEVIELAE